GVDLSAEAAELAKTQNGVQVAVGTLPQVAFPKDSFDLVTLFHVIEHVPNPHEVLAEVFRILRPEGAVVLQVPNVDSWQFKMLGAGWSALDIPRHLIDYPRDAMVRLLRDSGFEPRRSRHFNMRDNEPALVARLLLRVGHGEPG